MAKNKSWAWINTYEEARKKYGVAKSKELANKTIKKRVAKRKKDMFDFGF